MGANRGSGDPLPRGFVGQIQPVANQGGIVSSAQVLTLTVPVLFGRLYRATFNGLLSSSVAGDSAMTILKANVTDLDGMSASDYFTYATTTTGYRVERAGIHQAVGTGEVIFSVHVSRVVGTGGVIVGATGTYLMVEDIGRP